MKSVFKIKSCALGAMLLVASLGSEALTLGRASGTALISQPFNLSISVSAAADEDVSDVCFEADVFYGENKVEQSKVTLVSEEPAAGRTWQVRVSARLPVDEPVVTVYLRSICSAKTSRRYVLLADIVSETAKVAAAQVTPVVPPALNRPGALASIPDADSVRSVPGREKKTDGPVKAPRTSPSVQAKQVFEPPAIKSKPRLKLAPLDLTVERDPVLVSSQELLSTPTEDAQKRGEAVALWRALNLTPEDILKDAARLKSMEADILSLRNASGENQKQMQDLVMRVERAESEKYFNPLVIGLSGLLLLLLAGGGWFFRRQAQRANAGSAWWSGSGTTEAIPETVEVSPSFLQSLSDQERAESNLPKGEGQTSQGAVSSVDIDLDIGAHPSASSEPVSSYGEKDQTSAYADSRDFSVSMPSSLRAVNSHEMIDVRQQAEFFMALGQYEEAISLLEGHVNDSIDLNPMVHIDLLKIFHTLSRKDKFDHYRREFNAVFTGYVPEYQSFNQGDGSLENFPEICDQLVKLWPSKEALSLIESYLVRTPGSKSDMRFELEAFKELLLLHAVCNRLVHALDGAPLSFSANRLSSENAFEVPTGPGPVSFGIPSAYQSGNSVDFELDITEDFQKAAPSEVDNLIDFDLPPLDSKKTSP